MLRLRREQLGLRIRPTVQLAAWQLTTTVSKTMPAHSHKCVKWLRKNLRKSAGIPFFMQDWGMRTGQDHLVLIPSWSVFPHGKLRSSAQQFSLSATAFCNIIAGLPKNGFETDFHGHIKCPSEMKQRRFWFACSVTNNAWWFSQHKICTTKGHRLWDFWPPSSTP